MSHEAQLLGLLWCEATQPSCNAATLTHNIGVAFRYLETPWEDKAKQIIGALITLNAGPMHTTIWAALFQQLRETDKPTIKVYVLKQFANVCWTVPTNQAANAFRAFALEVRPLLEDVNVVVNATFQRSFAVTIKCFSSFAEKALSNELFSALYRSLKEWKRPDSIRAASTVIAAMANDNPSCPSPEQLLRQARYDLDCFSFAVLLDTLVSFEVVPGRILDERRIAAFRDELSEILDSILAAPQANEKVVPPCVSAYRRLKQVCDSWEPVAAEAFALFIVDALAQAKVSKLLVCPFLHFLHETSCVWSRSSRTVWQLTGSSDPFVRADAYAALSTTVYVIDAPEQRLVLSDLLERLRFSIADNCSGTTVAILKFIKKLLLHARFPPSAEGLYLSKLLHLCRRHGKGLYHDLPAQLELLNVFLCASIAPEALVVFALELFSVSPDRAVAKKAFSVLRHFSTEVFLDSCVQNSGEYSDDANYFEAAIQMRRDEPFEDELLPFLRLHRTKGLSACIYARLCTLAENETKSSMTCIVVCDAVKEISRTSAAAIFDDIFFKHTTLCLLSQLLVLQDPMPSDAYVSLYIPKAVEAALGASADREVLDVLLLIAASGQRPAQTFAAAELATVFVQLSNLFLCSTAQTLDDVAISVIRYAMRNATLFTLGDVSERLFWMVVSHCIYEVWAAITAETVVSVRDPEIIAFLCRAHVKVGLPRSVQRELHALFTPQLLSYGNTDSELEEDSLRCILWLVGKFASGDVHSSVRGRTSSLQYAPKLTGNADIGPPPSGRRALKCLPAAESNFSRNDARSLAAAVRHVTAQLAERVLANTTGATPSNVLDALGALCNLARPAPAESGPAAPLLSNAVSLEQVYRIARDFTEAFPILSADASLDPPGHCLDHLLGQLPRERRAHSIPDALCLNSIAWLLSKLLQSWGRENAPDSALPAQLPCVLASYLPYLLRCDLPSYLCLLQSLRYLSVCGATPEVEAVYDVALPRLMEDLVDVRWGAGVAGCWYEMLVDCLSHVPGAVPDGGRQLSRRIWEGLWRGAGSVELSCNQRFTERVQRSLQHVIHGLALKSAQWELCRLVVLDSGLQSRRVALTPVAASAFSIESNAEAFFSLARELQERTWRSQLLQTQSAFVHHGALALDADSSRSLLFEFEKAVAPVRESPDERGEFAIGEEAPCIIAECVRDSLFSATDAVLAALNHFDFADIIQRRAVLHELAKMMARSDATTPSWAEVYFDVLYERAAWHDEGLWVACALAAAAVGQTELCWSKTVLASLIPASSISWKRELMRRIGQRAKISGAQREARRFFADASERLSALQGPPLPWKRELLAAALSVFSS
ncbi:hypothetical protein CGC21_26965 [Leishmania donovani]|uniref:Uncharacterized protein n=1 Tax=Leishmania donovani TaxID=5661 RepID=A0A504WZT9_LEIDO|nr:hypothetical protein CGC21_26965 [Leishmania donovani]